VDNAGLIVRRARPDELAACAALYVTVLRETFTWLPPERHKEGDFFAAALYRPQVFLHSLYVTERGGGVGKALLDHVSKAAGGVLQLKCQTANLRAQAFYLREGFRCTEAGEDDGIAWMRFVRAPSDAR
jgi:GNAT superfamily N-acetyltransferase